MARSSSSSVRCQCRSLFLCIVSFFLFPGQFPLSITPFGWYIQSQAQLSCISYLNRSCLQRVRRLVDLLRLLVLFLEVFSHFRESIQSRVRLSYFPGYLSPGLITLFSSQDVVDSCFVCWCCMPFVGQCGLWCLYLVSSLDRILLLNATCSLESLFHSSHLVSGYSPSLSSSSNSFCKLIFGLHDDLFFPFPHAGGRGDTFEGYMVVYNT